jgi:hypothetical protein
MKMPLNYEEAQAIAESTARFAIEGDSATRLLIGNLVKFLDEKGLIDKDEYLQTTLEMKKHLIENREQEGELSLEMVEKIFEFHINDLKTPD